MTHVPGNGNDRYFAEIGRWTSRSWHLDDMSSWPESLDRVRQVPPRSGRSDNPALLQVAAQTLQSAADQSQLSMNAICDVHRLLTKDQRGIGGRLRDGPAVVRLHSKVTFIPPPAEAARRGTVQFTTLLAEYLAATSDPHAMSIIAAEAFARFTDLHPFPDANGRVARSIAFWLLVRAGYQPIPGHSYHAFYSRHRAECFRALAHHEKMPDQWHCFFKLSVTASFTEPELCNIVGRH
jgi:Fic family protein